MIILVIFSTRMISNEKGKVCKKEKKKTEEEKQRSKKKKRKLIMTRVSIFFRFFKKITLLFPPMQSGITFHFLGHVIYGYLNPNKSVMQYK